MTTKISGTKIINNFEDVLLEIQEFSPVKFYTFYNYENYILQQDIPHDKTIFPSNSPFIMLVNNRNNQMILQDCNCGYNGNGPNRTLRFLNWFGFSLEQSERIKWQNGIYFEIDNTFKAIKSTLSNPAVFDSRKSDVLFNQIHLQQSGGVSNFDFDFSKQRIYVNEPFANQNDYYRNSLNLIQSLNPSGVVYSFKNFVSADDTLAFSENIAIKMNNKRSSYAVFYNGLSSVVFFDSKNNIFNLVNALSLYISSKPITQQLTLNQFVFNFIKNKEDFWQNIKYLLGFKVTLTNDVRF